MKANELMIGDWVVINENHPDCPFTRRVDIGDLSFFTKFAPIPLTAEILEKNWFEKYKMYHTLHEKQVRIEYYWHESRLEIQPYDGELWIRLAPLCFVHELQHALRLCGLKELADNFKI